MSALISDISVISVSLQKTEILSSKMEMNVIQCMGMQKTVCEWSCTQVAEGTALEMRQAVRAVRGFKSLQLRHKRQVILIELSAFSF